MLAAARQEDIFGLRQIDARECSPENKTSYFLVYDFNNYFHVVEILLKV